MSAATPRIVMSLRPDLSLRTDQRLALAPRMLQGIEFLQIATAELLSRVEQELERNETLDLGIERAGSAGDAEMRSLSEPQRVDPGAPDARVTRPDAPRSGGGEDADVKNRLLSQLPSGELDPIADLRMQLAWRDASEELSEQVLALAEALDERGLLEASDDELARLIGVADIAEPLAVLQSLEPRGLGARSGVEAMLLQLDPDDPDRCDLERLLTDHLDALAKNRIPDVARALGLDAADIQALIEKASRLDPRPGARFFDRDVEHIRPELVAYLGKSGELCLEFDDGTLPELSIDGYYEELARSADLDRATKRYLREKIHAARDLIDAIEQRKATLVRVARATLEHQAAFMRDGNRAIRPLRMSEIADVVGMHTSTVSRAIAGKWVRTPHGVLALREFFDGARGAAAESAAGAGGGRNAVKTRIREVIDAEDPSSPLSDDDVVSALAKDGLKIARRTVTKYRKELEIPASWRRRKYGT